MPLGDLPLQYPFPYKNSSGDAGYGGNTELIVSATQNPTGFNNATGALQVRGGAQFYKDVWIGGNLYVQGQIYSAAFTPVLAGTGTGDLVPIHSGGQIAITADQKVVVMSCYVAVNYSNAALTDLYIAGLPYVGADMAQFSSDVFCTFDQTVAMIDASSNEIKLLGPNLTGLSLTGTGTFSIILSFTFLTSSSTATFLPTWSSESGSVGTVTYNTRTGKWGAYNSAVVESVRLVLSTTGGVSPVGIRFSNPHTFNVSQTGSSSFFVSGDLAAQPLILKTVPVTNYQAVYNASTLAPQNSLDAGQLDLGVTSWYFRTPPETYTPQLGSTSGSLSATYIVQRGFVAYYDTGVLYYIRLVGSVVASTAVDLSVTLPSKNGIVPHVTKKIFSTLGQPIVLSTNVATDKSFFFNDSTGLPILLTGTVDFDIEISGTYNSLATYAPLPFSNAKWDAGFTGTGGTMTNTITSTSVLSLTEESSIVVCSVSCVYTGSPSNLKLTGLPFNSASVVQYLGDLTCLQIPVFGVVNPGTTEILLYNQSTFQPVSLVGAGTFTLTMSATVLTTKAHRSFVPVLGNATYNYRDALYAEFGGSQHAALTIRGSNGSMVLTGVTSTAPYVGIGNTFSSLQQPLLLENGTFINASTFLPTSATADYLIRGGFTYFTFSTPFTPVLGVESGSVGAVVYSTQTGAYTTYDDAVVYTLVLIGTYTGAVTGQINITGFPHLCDRACVSRQVKSTFGSPVYFTTVAGTGKGWLLNDSTLTAYTIDGAGSFEIRITGVYTK